MLTIYKASAGSGKTFTLTYRYIKLLLSYKDSDGTYRLRDNDTNNHRSILAVTFTNKATDEMKRRIIHELAVLAGMERGWTGTSPYRGRLMDELHCSADQLTRASATALRNLLFDFSFFQVSTIDSFFQIILRTFAREADLTGNYEVDLDNDRAMEAGVRDLFDSLRLDSRSKENVRLVEWITQFLLNELREGRGVAIFNRRSGAFSQLLDFVRQTDSEEFKAARTQMMEYLSDPRKPDAFRKQLAQASTIHRASTAKTCRHAIDMIEKRGYADGKLKVAKNVMDRLSDGATNGYDTAKTESSAIAKTLADPACAFNAALRKHLDHSPDAELTGAITEAMTALRESRQWRPLWNALTKQLYNLGLLEGVYRFIDAFRAENNTFLLSDTNSILKQIIGESDTPFVFERIGVWLSHFLIDEFQDTSRMQWDIMRPLMSQGPAKGNDSLIIGDEKQCIYRFRSSDPTLLQHQVEKDFQGFAGIEGDTPDGNTNWRSSSHVVNFNNRLFTILSRKLNHHQVYANVQQAVSPKHLGHDGYILVNQIDAADMESFNRSSLELMTEEMRRQLSAGYKGKDICVLVRKRAQGTMIINHLLRLTKNDPSFNGLRVISDDAMMLSSSPAVRLIISVLRYFNTLGEPLPSETGKQSKSARQAEIKLMLNRVEFLRSNGASAQDALKTAIETPDCCLDIKNDVTDMTCFNLPSLVERIIHRMLSHELETQCMFITAFQDVVADFCASGTTDLHSFLEWWDSKGCRSTVSAPDDENAIRVMTIHKSKGLEFRCVHVPMLSYNMVDFKGNEWFHKEHVPLIDDDVIPPLLALKPSRMLENSAFAEQYARRSSEQLLDELNILYVALTRASDELCITFNGNTRGADAIPVGDIIFSAVNEMDILTLHKRDTPNHGTTAEVSPQQPSGHEENTEIIRRTYGLPTCPQPEQMRKPTAMDPTATFPMPPYATADRNDLWANTRVDDLPDYETARDRGIMLHDVLSRVTRTGQLDRAVTCCARAGLIPTEQIAEIRHFLSKELNRPEVRPWFDNFKRAVNERELLMPDGSKLRPDRVVWTADGHTDVIDYKFGLPRKTHLSQVKQYMKSLSEMGHHDVRGFLWYVTEGLIIPVK